MGSTAAAPAVLQCSRLSHAQACWVKSGSVVQGRTSLRMPFPELVIVTPWDEASQSPAGRCILASGRDISEDGIAFRHRQSLPCRYAAVSYRGGETAEDEPHPVETLLVRLLWCRFLRSGAYLSGGRFERLLSPEFGEPFVPLLCRNNPLPVWAH